MGPCLNRRFNQILWIHFKTSSDPVYTITSLHYSWTLNHDWLLLYSSEMICIDIAEKLAKLNFFHPNKDRCGKRLWEMLRFLFKERHGGRKIGRLSTAECQLCARLSTLCNVYYPLAWIFPLYIDLLASGTPSGTWTPGKGNSGGILLKRRTVAKQFRSRL